LNISLLAGKKKEEQVHEGVIPNGM